MTPLKQKATAFVAALAVSAGGYQLVKEREGKSNTAYADPAHGWAVPTICYGHTAGVKRGDYKTDAECDTILVKEVDHFAEQVLQSVHVGLTQGELDAYTSFAFNVGIGAFNKSTVRRRLHAQDRWGACMFLLKYSYAGGKHMRGLWDRRYAEYNECIYNLPVQYKGRR